MKYYVTIEKTIRDGFEIEVDDSDEIENIVSCRVETGKDYDLIDSWDYAVCDEDGATVIDWAGPI